MSAICQREFNSNLLLMFVRRLNRSIFFPVASIAFSNVSILVFCLGFKIRVTSCLAIPKRLAIWIGFVLVSTMELRNKTLTVSLGVSSTDTSFFFAGFVTVGKIFPSSI